MGFDLNVDWIAGQETGVEIRNWRNSLDIRPKSFAWNLHVCVCVWEPEREREKWNEKGNVTEIQFYFTAIEILKKELCWGERKLYFGIFNGLMTIIFELVTGDWKFRSHCPPPAALPISPIDFLLTEKFPFWYNSQSNLVAQEIWYTWARKFSTFYSMWRIFI